MTARSDVPLRRLLSRVFLVLFAAGTVLFAVLAARAGSGPVPDRGTFIAFALLCAAFVGIAAIDLIVLRRRR